jgi:hypothetical protein
MPLALTCKARWSAQLVPIQSSAVVVQYLCVRQVVAFVVVKRQTQSTFNLAKVIPHVVWVLGEIDCLQSKPSQPFPSVDGLAQGTR